MLIACPTAVAHKAWNGFSDVHLWALNRPAIRLRPGYSDKALLRTHLKQGNTHKMNSNLESEGKWSM